MRTRMRPPGVKEFLYLGARSANDADPPEITAGQKNLNFRSIP